MADAIYGGATIEATQNDMVRQLQSTMKGYQRQLFHDGVYAVVTLMANDDSQRENPGQEDGEEGTLEKTEQPRKCYIFCPERDRVRLFEELDHKTAAPLIPAFRDYVLASLQKRGNLRQLEVISQKERITHGRWIWNRMIRSHRGTGGGAEGRDHSDPRRCTRRPGWV